MIAAASPKVLLAAGTTLVHGASGTGKSFLLASCAQWLEDHDRSARFESGDTLTEGFADALGRAEIRGWAEAVRSRYLLVDDVDDLRRAALLQRSLGAILREGGGEPATVLALRSPAAVPHLIDALGRSCTMLQLRPDRARLRAAVSAIARQRRLELDRATIKMIVAHSRGSYWEIEGAVSRIAFFVQACNEEPHRELVRWVLGRSGRPLSESRTG